jgi:hypothetical protein
MAFDFGRLYVIQKINEVKLKYHSKGKKGTSPKGMEEHIRLEWITVFLHLCSMQ